MHALLARAVERGALPPGSDVGFLGELLLAPVKHRIFMLDEPVDAAFLARIVDHVLAGIPALGEPAHVVADGATTSIPRAPGACEGR